MDLKLRVRVICARCAIGPFHSMKPSPCVTSTNSTSISIERSSASRDLTRETVRAAKNFAHQIFQLFFVSYLITSEVAHDVNIKSTQGLARVPGKAYTTEKRARSLPSTWWWVTRRSVANTISSRMNGG